MIGKIYLITNQINNKKYVGKTYNSIEVRWREHCHDAYKERYEKRPLYNAIQKYGINNFTISLIEETDNLEEREQYWILYYDTYKNGYNATLGGDGKLKYNYTLFKKDYEKGMLVNEIANKYNCDSHTVTKALRTFDINGRINFTKKTSNEVYQYDLNNNYIQKFTSQREAARYLISKGAKGSEKSITANIGRVLKGNRKTAEGYIWKKE